MIQLPGAGQAWWSQCPNGCCWCGAWRDGTGYQVLARLPSQHVPGGTFALATRCGTLGRGRGQPSVRRFRKFVVVVVLLWTRAPSYR